MGCRGITKEGLRKAARTAPSQAAGGAASPPLTAGDVVRLHGLQRRVELNGLSGTLVVCDAGKGCWEIQLAAERVLAKPVNFTKVGPDGGPEEGEYTLRCGADVIAVANHVSWVLMVLFVIAIVFSSVFCR